MYDGDHQLASHTWSHADLCNITSAQRKDEMYKNEMALRNIVGVIPTYMRPPYSSCNAGKQKFEAPSRSRMRDNRADQDMYRMWMRSRHGRLRLSHNIFRTYSLSFSHSFNLSFLSHPMIPTDALSSQDLDTSDYLNDSPTLIQNSKTIFDTALAGKSPTTDEFLVIGHDIHNQTANVLVEYMLQGLQKAGYKAVTVGECLGDPKENWYRTDTGATLGN